MWDNGLHHTHIWPQTMLALCATMVFTTQTSGHRQWWPYVKQLSSPHRHLATDNDGLMWDNCLHHTDIWPQTMMALCETIVFTTQTSGHRQWWPYVRQLSSPHRHLATDNDGLIWDNCLHHTYIWPQTMMALCETTVFTTQTSGHRQWWPYLRQLSSPHRHMAIDNNGFMWDNCLHHTDIWPQTMMALFETTIVTTQTYGHSQ